MREVGSSFVKFASQIPSGFFGGRSRNYENKLKAMNEKGGDGGNLTDKVVKKV
ncbi:MULTISPECIES: hypothetical protein [unclassified Sphingobacterium]|uniref:hypothetical protein n=1 Tax=unclassified Sphingobacterium TaxID=2609468 RepID=UPI001404F52B|nr:MULTISPECIES: hypothetical protein [unclassified Sphingobacterium]MCS3552668.1 hypothetical protein [Sphingobacterium sp. JUb21]